MKKLSLVILLALAMIWFVGCAPDEEVVDDPNDVVDEPVDEPSEDITAVWSNIAETASLDPHVVFSSDGLMFARNVYEGLYEYKPGGFDERPLLATGHVINEDATVYTFELRDDVEFHDGTPFNAEAVKISIQRILEVGMGPASLAVGIEEINVLGDYEVEIVLKSPDVFFLSRLPKLPIVSPTAIEENKTDEDPLAEEWFRENASGTGPYKFDEWYRNERIELVKNENYWQEWEEGTPTKGVMRVDPDVSTALQLLAEGSVNMIGAVGPDDANMAETLPNVKVVEQPSHELKTIHLNTRKAPLDDVNVRRAIMHAIDYESYRQFFGGYARPSIGPMATTMEGASQDLEPYVQDMDKAREYLAEAGYEDGFELQFMALRDQTFQVFAADLLESNLGELGIQVKAELLPWPQMPELMSRVEEGPHISFLNMTPQTGDPSTHLENFLRSDFDATVGGYNWSFYNNPRVDEWIAEVPTIVDEDERNEVLNNIQQAIRDDVPVITLCEISLFQPVREEWDVRYEPMDNIQVVRFFYTRKGVESPHY